MMLASELAPQQPTRVVGNPSQPLFHGLLCFLLLAHFGELRLVAGNANPVLAERIAAELGQPLEDAKVDRFDDGEVKVDLDKGEAYFEETAPVDMNTITDEIKKAGYEVV